MTPAGVFYDRTASLIDSLSVDQVRQKQETIGDVILDLFRPKPHNSILDSARFL